MAKRIPAVEGLFGETPQGPRLFGSRCRTCGTPYFPRSAVCHNPGCERSAVEDAQFGPHGTLWSYAIQNYPPPAPARYDEPYVPYAIGVVDLAEGLRVVGRIASGDPASLEVGSAVELVLEPLAREAGGDELVSWKFKPVRAS
jgi:uncharacterized OB-fold protein